jgi:peptidoglycan/xylan/chitin deacetylase (PgdA/CDA1 family)
VSGRLPLLIIALGCLALAAGCGDRDDEIASAATEYSHLDPPDLANLLVDEIEPGVPVLCYHYFREDFKAGYLVRVLGSVLLGMPALGDREFWTTPRAEFARHLQWFRDTGTRVMTLDEVADLLDAGEPLPRRAVVLTIDDADRSVYEVAWPLLREYGVRAHLFVPTSQVGEDWSSLQVCSWEELREMADSGAVVVGSHTRDLHYKVKTDAGWEPVFWHPDAVTVEDAIALRAEVRERWDDLRENGVTAGPEEILADPAGTVLADLLASRLDIADEIGAPAAWLSWPYGFANDRLDSLARVVGFRGTVSLSPHVITDGDSLHAMGRVTLTARNTTGQVKEVMTAAAR